MTSFFSFQHSGSELLVLLTNTMLTDLKSDNVVEVNIALVAAAHLVPNDMIPVIFPIVLQRTNHPKVINLIQISDCFTLAGFDCTFSFFKGIYS